MLMDSGEVQNSCPEEMYLTLMRKALTRYEMERHLTVVSAVPYGRPFSWKGSLVEKVNVFLRNLGFEIAQRYAPDMDERLVGRDWPINAETMVGLRRLEQLNAAMHTVMAEGVQGDFLETGVWRGGASIYMAAFNKVYGLKRKIIAADSFQGLPKPKDTQPIDADSVWHQIPYLSVPLDEVRANFDSYGLLDDSVEFLVGFFSESMAQLASEKLAILRLDGDMYDSTHDVLVGAYDRVTPGGFVVVDDFSLDGARMAVADFLASRGQQVTFSRIDDDSIFWRKTGE